MGPPRFINVASSLGPGFRAVPDDYLVVQVDTVHCGQHHMAAGGNNRWLTWRCWKWSESEKLQRSMFLSNDQPMNGSLSMAFQRCGLIFFGCQLLGYVGFALQSATTRKAQFHVREK